MKSYSSDTISRTEVEAVVAHTVTAAVSEIDAKQSEQIKQLRIWVGVSFAVNLLVAVGAYLV